MAPDSRLPDTIEPVREQGGSTPQDSGERGAPNSGSNLVSWATAERVALRISSNQPILSSQQLFNLSADFEEFTGRAEELVRILTDMPALPESARAKVIDRPSWVRANLASFEKVLSPMLTQANRTKLPEPVATAARMMAGAELGLALGWMSSRVLGQYDMLVADRDALASRDAIYYIGPNIVSLEQRFSFPPRQFRLWLALHEVTHRYQFLTVPWLADYFFSLVSESFKAVTMDRNQVLEGIKRSITELLAGNNPIATTGLIGIVVGPEQRLTIERLQALMSLLEGYGDVVMNQAGENIPAASFFDKVLKERRYSARGLMRLVQQLTGLETKLKQYEQGERFVREVLEHGGNTLLAKVWEAPEHLPTLAELLQPSQWIERIQYS
ncbi:MAG: zinc-dependent metalloprotease [Actinobacteria bacterium]|nr:zinc-dependent metalloprotease [Actinomycetota bacterium]MCL6095102.1 zinc-dependent metalloprotease [Actinomycetota bacterium]